MRFLFPLALLALMGCSSLAAMPQLAGVDFQTVKLDALRIAFRLPQSLAPRDGDVTMNVAIGLENAPERVEHFALVLDAAHPAPQPVAGFSAHVFRMESNDVARFEAMRREVAAYQQAGRRGSISIGVGAAAFCSRAPLADGAVLLSSYVFAAEAGRFVALQENFDLRSDPRTAAGLEDLPPC